MRSADWICKKLEIIAHLRKLFLHYGENDNFFDEYLNSVLKHDIDKTLSCFRDLVSQMDWVPAIKERDNAA